MKHKPYGIYEQYVKRPLDFVLAIIASIFFFPILIIISVLVRKEIGSPIFFSQERVGMNEKVFKMHKFRTMTNEKDKEGNLLPDEERLTKFGRFLRATSIDELPELLNIIKGDMAVIGPRPLLVKYLPLYSKEQHRRHEVRPGLSGKAQINGRNTISWTERFKLDIEYVDNITFLGDIKIILCTIIKVLKREGINSATSATMEGFNGNN